MAFLLAIGTITDENLKKEKEYGEEISFNYSLNLLLIAILIH